MAQARATYDRVAAIYDLAENPFERRARTQGLRLLAARPGERVLEIGPGTGHALAAVAQLCSGDTLTIHHHGRPITLRRGEAVQVPPAG